MTLDVVRAYCLSKPGTSEDFPFDQDTLVIRVMEKIFALLPLENWDSGKPSINLKCDPDYAQELRARYTAVIPGYHMNKKHWNTIHLYESDLPAKLLFELIDHSYTLIVESLPKSKRELL